MKKNHIVSNIQKYFLGGMQNWLLGTGTTNGANDGDTNEARWRNVILDSENNSLLQDIYLLDDTIKNNITLSDNPDLKKLKDISNFLNLTKNKKININHTKKIGDKGKKISGGQKQRISLGRALYKNSQILILDEPTAGVDVALRQRLWDNIKTLNKAGVTVVLTTHYLEEAERLCRNIAIIDSGEIVENTSMQELLTRLEEETFVFDLKNPLETLPTNLGYDAVLENPQKLKVTIGKGQGLNTIFEVLSNSGIQISSMRNDTGRLEELFMGLVDSNLNGGER